MQPAEKAKQETKQKRKAKKVKAPGCELQGFEEIESLLSQISGVTASVIAEIKSSLGVKAQDLLKHPERIYDIGTLSDNMKGHIYNVLKEVSQRKSFDMLSGYLRLYGIDAGTIYGVLAHFDFLLDAVERIKRNPYILVLFNTDSDWFSKLDEMASDLGTYSIDSEMRKYAKIVSILLSEEKNGHCYTKWGMLESRLVKELKDLPYTYTRDDARQDITNMLRHSGPGKEKGRIPSEFYISSTKVIDDGKPYRAVYKHDTFLSEVGSAKYIVANQKATEPPSGLTAWLKKRQEENEKPETEEQTSAINMFWRNRISILTGGPGTGKTHTIHAILSSIEDLTSGLTTILAAPTGRAARRMEEMTGHEAQTIHSLLNHLRNRPHHADAPDPEGQLKADIAIIDETSMLDITMLKTLFRSLKDGTRILFVGDSDQLPSVEPGNVLQDLLLAGVPSTRLSLNHRSADTIARNAHRIIAGDTNLAYDSDFKIIPAGTTSEMREAIKKESNSPDTQVLTSRKNKVDISAEKLNPLLRSVINPGPISPEKNYRANDKVICVKNNRKKAVCNGEIGTVTGIQLDEKGGIQKVTTEFNGKEVAWNWIEANVYLEFAYAITVHKSQGSEYDTIIVPLPEEDNFTSINLFYTAVTRARNKVILIGKEERIEHILAKQPRPRRTRLVAAINAYRKKAESSA